MVNDSIVLRSLIGLYGWLGKSYRFSLLARVLKVVSTRLATWLAASGILNFLWRDGYLARHWENSLICGALDAAVNLPSRLLRRVYLKLEAAFQSSVTHRILKFLAERIHILTALFLLVALVVPHSRWENLYSTLAAGGLLLLFLYRTAVDPEAKFRVKAFDIFLVLFFVTLVLAQILSLYPGLSSRFFIFYLTDLLLVLILVSSIKNGAQLCQVLEVVLVGVTLSGMYGVYQGIKGVPVIVSQIDLDVNEGMPGRIYSTLDNPNNYAEVLVMLLPFYFSAIVGSKGIFRKLFFALMAVPPFISLLMTLSRSSWIGFAVAILIMMFFLNRKLFLVLVVGGVVLFPVLLPFLPQTISKRILSITNMNDTSTATRFDIYKSMVPMLKDFWYSGIGLGSDVFVKLARNYYQYTKQTPVHSHNVLLQVWFETGILGFVAFMGTVLRTFKRGAKTVFGSAAGKAAGGAGLVDRDLRNILICGMGALGGVMVISLAEYVWFYPRVMLVFWVLLGILTSALYLAGKQETASM